uniref:Uncharacterized protein n=1 Tax=Aegilops tauschii subsp. strangulata TaxID=200361 RepID=A0A453C3A1_AEGTS
EVQERIMHFNLFLSVKLLSHMADTLIFDLSWQSLQYNRCEGTISVYQSNISKHKLELKQTQYKDIEKRYFNQLLQLKTTEMANKDLERYYAALDK